MGWGETKGEREQSQRRGEGGWDRHLQAEGHVAVLGAYSTRKISPKRGLPCRCFYERENHTHDRTEEKDAWCSRKEVGREEKKEPPTGDAGQSP